MLTERARSEGAKKAAEKRKQEGQDVATNIRDAKRLTTGILTANGIHSLRDPRFLDSFRKRECAKTAKRDKAASVKRSKKKRNVSGVTAMRENHGHERTHHFLQCVCLTCPPAQLVLPIRDLSRSGGGVVLQLHLGAC